MREKKDKSLEGITWRKLARTNDREYDRTKRPSGDKSS